MADENVAIMQRAYDAFNAADIGPQKLLLCMESGGFALMPASRAEEARSGAFP